MTFLCFHVGAGEFSRQSEILHLMQNVSSTYNQQLCNGEQSHKVVLEVVKELENSPLTNAGYGSNLNENGIVECDASIMYNQRFNSITGLQGYKNPIQVAYEASILPENKYGRCNASILSAAGANSLAAASGCKTAALETPSSLKRWRRWRQALGDTVGAIAIDTEGNISLAVSSGGTLLKPSGRVGPAAVAGAGFWATSDTAICCSGRGEGILQSCMAISSLSGSPLPPQTGFIQLSKKSNYLEFNYKHNTPHFAIAYGDKCLISNCARGETIGGTRHNTTTNGSITKN